MSKRACYILLVLSLLLLTGCRSVKYVPVETVRIDTIYQSKIEKDSIHIHDSIYVKEWQNGDTIYKDRDRWHTEYIDKLVHDTIYQSKTDSIQVPYPVEKELTWWEEVKIKFSEVIFLVISVLFGVILIKMKLK